MEARAQNNDDAWWWADNEAARHGDDDYDDYFDDWVDDKADEAAWMKRVEEERIVKELRAFEAEEGDDDGTLLAWRRSYGCAATRSRATPNSPPCI